MAFLGRVATRIINEVKGVNRVVYAVISKLTGTIDWGRVGGVSPLGKGLSLSNEQRDGNLGVVECCVGV